MTLHDDGLLQRYCFCPGSFDRLVHNMQKLLIYFNTAGIWNLNKVPYIKVMALFALHKSYNKIHSSTSNSDFLT